MRAEAGTIHDETVDDGKHVLREDQLQVKHNALAKQTVGELNSDIKLGPATSGIGLPSGPSGSSDQQQQQDPDQDDLAKCDDDSSSYEESSDDLLASSLLPNRPRPKAIVKASAKATPQATAASKKSTIAKSSAKQSGLSKAAETLGPSPRTCLSVISDVGVNMPVPIPFFSV